MRKHNRNSISKFEEALNLSSNSFRSSYLLLYTALTEIITPRSQSDRTGFRRICRWAAHQSERGVFSIHEGGKHILRLAAEATGERCRVPAAVFMALIKKELGYDPKDAPD
jgi:hypothetical protein